MTADETAPQTQDPASPESPPAGRWVSTEEAARLLGLSDRTIRRHITRGLLKGERDGSHALRVWIEGDAAASEPPEPGDEPDAAPAAGQGSLPAVPMDAVTWALAEHLADLTRHNAELVNRIESLAAEAATYRERIRIYEDQEKALPAGEPPVWRPWWKRLLGIE